MKLTEGAGFLARARPKRESDRHYLINTFDSIPSIGVRSVKVGKATKKTSTRGPFVQIYRYMMATEAWHDLSPTAKALYVELKGLYNGRNNGALAFSAREAGAALGIGKSSASRFFVELEAHGFIVREKLSSFNQKRLSIEWRLTELKNDTTGSLPTKEFARWHLNRPKKNKPVPPVERIGPVVGLPTYGTAAQTVTRPSVGPARSVRSTPQAHLWATSTYSPEGGRSPATSTMATTSQLDTIPEIGSEEADPVVRTILEMFPGSTVRPRGSAG